MDPVISLAFSIHYGRGTYALLLGSGISSAAMVPTGWQITMDLVRKVAATMKENCEPDPEAWYKEKFGEEPDYSKLLDSLTKSQAKRSQLLRSYFEPTEQERQEGIKQPTEAHKAIADLVALGYIRVIVTTNFDRLMERALEAVGIVPTVLATPDAIKGSLPVQHTQCTIVKVHGDYVDMRLKNTSEELQNYEPEFDQLLDRILDEYGLIVCGWSADWDPALRRAIERCSSRRFTTYWTARGKLSEAAARLVELRKAEVIKITDADGFFQALSEKVSALEEVERPHPLSVQAAVVSLKTYIHDPTRQPRLEDLVIDETEKLYSFISGANFPMVQMPFNAETMLDRMKRHEAAVEMVGALLTMGCYWGNEPQEYLWTKCIERIANLRGDTNGALETWINLRRYPTLLLAYMGGIAAIARGKYGNVAALLSRPTFRQPNYPMQQPLVLAVNPLRTLDDQYQKWLPGMERRHTPFNDYLYDTLREPLKTLIPDDDTYAATFDRFEYMLGLVHADLYQSQAHGNRFWGPVGSFSWRSGWLTPEDNRLSNVVGREMSAMEENWPPLRAGLFNGSLVRALEVKGAYDELVGHIAANRH